MGTYYDRYLTSPEGQAAKNISPDQAGFGEFRGMDETNNPVWANNAGDIWSGANYTPPDPYAGNGNGANAAPTSVEQASEWGLFGSTDANFGDALRNTFKNNGKTDQDLINASWNALQQHGKQFNQGYDAASNWGAIDNAIFQNAGINLNGFDFQSLGGGFTADAAQNRGNADRAKNFSGTFGQDNFFSSAASAQYDRMSNIGTDFYRNPERIFIGGNNPVEATALNTIFGTNYKPEMTMTGMPTNDQNRAYAQQGGSVDESMLLHQGGSAFAGGAVGSAAAPYETAAKAGDSFQNGKLNSDNLMNMTPSVNDWIMKFAQYLGGGNGETGGSFDNQSLQGSANNDTLGGRNNMADENMNFDYGGTFGPSMMPQGDNVSNFQPGDTFGPNSMFGSSVNNGPSLLDYLSGVGGGDPSMGGTGGIAQPQGGGVGDTGGGAGGLGGFAAKAGINFLLSQYLANRASSNAQQTQQAGNPLNDPKRNQFQTASADLVANPENYFANNPFASALTAQYKNNVLPAQLARSGNAGEVVDRLGSQFATALGGNYNALLQTLMGYGGFQMPNNGIGASVPLQQQANQNIGEGFRGIGNLAEQIFGTPQQPKGQGNNDTLSGAVRYIS